MHLRRAGLLSGQRLARLSSGLPETLLRPAGLGREDEPEMPGDVALAFELVLLMFFRWCSEDESADTETQQEAIPEMSNRIGEPDFMAAAKKTAGTKPSAKKPTAKSGSSAMGLASSVHS